MSELSERLRAKVLARKDAALKAGPAGSSGIWHVARHLTYTYIHDNETVFVVDEVPNRTRFEHFEHIALNDPADTIARCDFELAALRTYEHAEREYFRQSDVGRALAMVGELGAPAHIVEKFTGLSHKLDAYRSVLFLLETAYAHMEEP